MAEIKAYIEILRPSFFEISLSGLKILQSLRILKTLRSTLGIINETIYKNHKEVSYTNNNNGYINYVPLTS